MTSPAHPVSYNDYALPQIKLSHHPASSPVPTPVILVILNRPEANNAFTDTMVSSLVTAFNLLSNDPRVKAIVFTGGDPENRVFCPGMDLDGAEAEAEAGRGARPPTAAELHRQREAHRDGGAQVSLAIYHCNKPVVAALNGHAVGVGLTMTLACNLRVASAAAKVGLVFARRGIALEGCSSFFLPRLLGAGRALALATTGAVHQAGDAAVRDLFAEVVAPDRVVPRALELAADVAARTSAVSTRAMRDMLYRGPATPEAALALESRVFFDLFRGPDCREGIRAFLEKREPRFEGRWDHDKPAVWPWWEKKKDESGGGVLAWLKSRL